MISWILPQSRFLMALLASTGLVQEILVLNPSLAQPITHHETKIVFPSQIKGVADSPDPLQEFKSEALNAYLAKDYSKAKLLYEKILEEQKRDLGDDHPDVAITLRLIANILNSEQHFSEAESLLKRAVGILEKSPLADPKNLAMMLNSLAGVYQNQGKFTQAEPLYQRALGILEKTAEPTHLFTLLILNNLVVLYANTDQTEKNISTIKKLLPLLEKNPEKISLDFDLFLFNVGAYYQIKHEYAEAESIFRKALAMTDEKGGRQVWRPWILLYLAELYRVQGRLAESEPLYRSAFSVIETSHGPVHFYIVEDVTQTPFYKTFIQRAKSLKIPLDRLEPLLQGTAAMIETIRGPNNPETAVGFYNLAEFYRLESRNDAAEQNYRRSIGILEKALDSDDSDLAIVLDHYAGLLSSMGRLTEAKTVGERASAIRAENELKESE